MRDQLVEARIGERVVLHLDDRPPTRHAQADRRAEHARLGERRVDAPVGAEAVAQPGGGAEDAAGTADVLTEHHHVVVTCELGVQRVVDRLDERQLSHGACSPAGRRRRA